jgi:hypothetical protein
MAQDLTVNIKTTSDVPQAMDKAKSATVSFSKQVEDIQKKFSTGFKDIFLGFFAPMVLLNAAISYFSNKIAEAQKLAMDGFDKLADSSTRYGTAEEKSLAARLKMQMDLIKAQKEERAGKNEMFKQYLMSTPEGQAIVNREISKGGEGFQMGMKIPAMKEKYISGLAMMKQIQEEILKIEDRKITPEMRRQNQHNMELAQKAELQAAEDKKKAEEARTKSLSSPGANSVSGNVIGVGANPVVTALQEQQAIAKASLTQLEIIAAQFGYAATYKDVTASGATPHTPANASPSRAALLTKNK